MNNEAPTIKRTSADTRREKFENTTLVAAAMVDADRRARAEKNARLKAAREASQADARLDALAKGAFSTARVNNPIL